MCAILCYKQKEINEKGDIRIPRGATHAPYQLSSHCPHGGLTHLKPFSHPSEREQEREHTHVRICEKWTDAEMKRDEERRIARRSLSKGHTKAFHEQLQKALYETHPLRNETLAVGR